MPVINWASPRGCSSVGRAVPWHGIGHGFDSRQLHFRRPPDLSGTQPEDGSRDKRPIELALFPGGPCLRFGVQSSVVPLPSIAVAPKAIELVEVPRLVEEDVHNEVPVVHQHPPRIVEPFD